MILQGLGGFTTIFMGLQPFSINYIEELVVMGFISCVCWFDGFKGWDCC